MDGWREGGAGLKPGGSRSDFSRITYNEFLFTMNMNMKKMGAVQLSLILRKGRFSYRRARRKNTVLWSGLVLPGPWPARGTTPWCVSRLPATLQCIPCWRQDTNFSPTQCAHITSQQTSATCSYSEPPRWFTSSRAQTVQNLSAGRALGGMMSTMTASLLEALRLAAC